MERYKNLSGNSGIRAFEIRANEIIVQFKSGDIYLYDDYHPGRKTVDQMKKLALSGRGLSTFISQHVRENFAAEL